MLFKFQPALLISLILLVTSSCKKMHLTEPDLIDETSSLNVYSLDKKINKDRNGAEISDVKLQERLRTNYLLTYSHEQPSVAELIKYIEKSHKLNIYKKYPLKYFTKEEMASKIIDASKCFGVDAYAYAGLIRQESVFRHLKYRKGKASGITQFTWVAMEEVNGQLGKVPFSDDKNVKMMKYKNPDGTISRRKVSQGASQIVMDYLNNTINNCYAPKQGWTPLWDLAEQRMLAEKKRLGSKFKSWSSKRYYDEYRHIFIENPDIAIVYGAILLKLHLLIGKYNKQKSRATAYAYALRKYNANDNYHNYKGRFSGRMREYEHYWRIILFQHVRDIKTASHREGLVILNPSFKIMPASNPADFPEEVATNDPYVYNPRTETPPQQDPVVFDTTVDESILKSTNCQASFCMKPHMVMAPSLLVRESPPSKLGVKGKVCNAYKDPVIPLLVFKGDEIIVVDYDSESGWFRIDLTHKTGNWKAAKCKERWIDGTQLKPLY